MTMNRRRFLKSSAFGVPGSVLTVGVLEQLMLSLIEGLYNKAYAEVAGHAPRNYVHMHFDSAPPRFTFDQVLIPSAADRTNGRFMGNPSMGTAFTRDAGGNVTGLDYRTFNVNGVEMPWIWKFDVATSAGGRRPAADLLKNFAVIRGINSGIDGHEFNRERATYPEPSGVSLSGGVADKASTPMSAVAGSGVSWFRSAMGLAPSVVNRSGNAIADLRKAFDYTSLASNVPLTKKSQYDDAIARASEAVKFLVRGNGPKSALLKGNLERAESIIRSASEDLSALWNSGLVRYNTVIQNSVNPSILYPSGIPGLTDQALTAEAPRNSSLWRLYTTAGVMYVPQGTDLRSVVTTPFSSAAPQTLNTLAQTLLLSEYVLTRGLSNVVTMPMASSPILNLNIPAGSIVGPGDNNPLTGTEGTYGGLTASNSDEHFGGPYASTLIHSMMWRGVIAGLLEFTEVLKRNGSSGSNLFENTVIQITSDFNRTPRVDGFGSDHGYWGTQTSVFSGAFTNGPVVAGNILTQARGARETQSKDNLKTDGSPLPTSDGTYNMYLGSWGAAAKVQFGSLSEQVGLKHVAASVAQLLRIDPNPWPFNNQIWSLDGQTLRAVSAKNVKDDER